MACTTAEISALARVIGSRDAYCIATKFCANYGRTAQCIEYLVAWGNARGMRSSTTGAWTCTDTAGPPAESALPPCGGNLPTTTDPLAALLANPVLLIGGAVVLLLLLKK